MDRTLVFLLALSAACSDDPLFEPATAADAPAAVEAACATPTEPAALFAWLRAGSYRGFAHESAVHDSATRIHAERVLVFGDGARADGEQPRCTALVKEFHRRGDDAITGYAVAVKTRAASDGGAGWYWFETFDAAGGRPSTSGEGAAICVGCHSAGQDFVRSPLPLR